MIRTHGPKKLPNVPPKIFDPTIPAGEKVSSEHKFPKENQIK